MPLFVQYIMQNILIHAFTGFQMKAEICFYYKITAHL